MSAASCKIPKLRRRASRHPRSSRGTGRKNARRVSRTRVRPCRCSSTFHARMGDFFHLLEDFFLAMEQAGSRTKDSRHLQLPSESPQPPPSVPAVGKIARQRHNETLTRILSGSPIVCFMLFANWRDAINACSARRLQNETGVCFIP